MAVFRSTLLRTHWALYAKHLARSRSALLIGPWRSEVGFEVLYWLPFLQAFRDRYQIDRNRLIAIGRGGSHVWYDTAGGGDLYEHAPLDMVRTLTVQSSQQTGSVKQYQQEPWERHVCALAATSIGLKDYHVLSPSWMYRLLSPYWEGTRALESLDGDLQFAQRLPAPKLDPSIAKQLPSDFVVMRWYTRPTWPLTEANLLWTRKLVEAVASRIPVVLINSGLHADDHSDINLGKMKQVINLADIAPQTPLNNLAIQSAVIAKAQGYVGTYGGMSQLAMRLGIPTLALYDQFNYTATAHLTLTHHLSLKTGVPFYATYPKSLDALLPIVLARNGTQREPVAAS